MKVNHIHFILFDGHTTFKYTGGGGGSDPAKNLQDHLNNISNTVNRYLYPYSIEITLDNNYKDAKVVEN